jgi:hypothetical protein
VLSLFLPSSVTPCTVVLVLRLFRCGVLTLREHLLLRFHCFCKLRLVPFNPRRTDIPSYIQFLRMAVSITKARIPVVEATRGIVPLVTTSKRRLWFKCCHKATLQHIARRPDQTSAISTSPLLPAGLSIPPIALARRSVRVLTESIISA